MSVYAESGMTVTLTGLVHHRFESLPIYQKLKGKHIKEIDFFWLQQIATPSLPANTLIGLELKGYDQTVLDVDSVLENLVQKARDSMAMLHAAWLNTGDGALLRQQLPVQYNSYHAGRQIRLIMLINVQPSQSARLLALRDKFKNKISGLERIYGISTTLVNLSTAQTMGLPVV